MGILAHRRWRLDSPRISGVSGNCFSIRLLPLLGLNPHACGNVAKHLSLIRRFQNDREGVLANILYPIQIGPNGREDALLRSLEHIHRLVGSYQFFEEATFPQNILGRLVIFQQFIDQFASDGHVLLLVFIVSIAQALTIYTNYYTVSLRKSIQVSIGRRSRSPLTPLSLRIMSRAE